MIPTTCASNGVSTEDEAEEEDEEEDEAGEEEEEAGRERARRRGVGEDGAVVEGAERAGEAGELDGTLGIFGGGVRGREDEGRGGAATDADDEDEDELDVAGCALGADGRGSKGARTTGCVSSSSLLMTRGSAWDGVRAWTAAGAAASDEGDERGTRLSELDAARTRASTGEADTEEEGEKKYLLRTDWVVAGPDLGGIGGTGKGAMCSNPNARSCRTTRRTPSSLTPIHRVPICNRD